MTNHANGVLGLLFPQVARESLVRNHPTSFTEKLQAYIAKKLLPETLTVRGNLVAIDYITEALIGHGTMSRYELFVEPAFVEKAKVFSTLRGQDNPQDSEIRVTSLLDLLHGVDRYSLTAFFNPSGNFCQPLALRNNFASKLYPVATLTHGFSLHSMLYDGFLRLLLQGSYPCDSMICTSRASRAAMVNILAQVAEQFHREFQADIKYSGRLDVLPLCVDTDKFKPCDKTLLRNRLQLPQKAVILLYLGYVSALKAELLPLLLVFRRLLKENPHRELLLMIAGTADATYAATLKKYIQDFSLSKHVRLIEGLSDKMKYDLIAAADVFVSPGDSLQESFGLTPVEAMACGVPQVVADWDGYRDTVAHGETGFCVPTYWTRCDSDLTDTGHLLGWEFDHLALGQSVAIDVGELQSCLQTLVENVELRGAMAERSRERAMALYSFSAVAKRYEELWSELSAIASGLSFTKTGIDFDRPQYFEYFKNHASSVISDDSPLTVTPLGRGMSDQDLLPLLHAKVSGYKTINLSLVRRVVDELNMPSQSAGRNGTAACIRLGDVVNSLTKDNAFHPDYVRRNVMWLMKHGFVEPEISNVHEQSCDLTEDLAQITRSIAEPYA